MKLLSSWDTFWFSKSPCFDLALLRLITVGFSLIYLFGYSFPVYHHALSLPDALWLPFPALKVLMLPFGWGVRPDPALVHTVFWFTVATGVLAFVGLLTNISLLAFAVGNVFLQTYIYAFGDSHHREAIMVITLAVFALAPCGRLLSVDSVISSRKRSSELEADIALLDYKSIYAGWPIKLMQCFFALMYLSAVTSKLSLGGWAWANGFTLQYYLVQDGIRHNSELALFFAQYHVFINMLQYVVLLFQATFFLIIFFPKLRWFYLPVGLCFHIGIWLTLQAPFPQWIILYALFIPWSQAVRSIYECKLVTVHEGEASARNAAVA